MIHDSKIPIKDPVESFIVTSDSVTANSVELEWKPTVGTDIEGYFILIDGLPGNLISTTTTKIDALGTCKLTTIGIVVKCIDIPDPSTPKELSVFAVDPGNFFIIYARSIHMI